MVKCLVLLIAVLAGCSTKANPNACCVSADDCKQAGLSDVKSCDQGLTCVNNQCLQETCSTDGCMLTQPVCNVVTNACEGCTDSTQCASYPGAMVCDTSSGGCVGCVGPSDCPSDKPVCDMNTCRACVADADCASGACADDGTCVAESAIVYLDPAGTDTGSCPASAPCRSITYGATQTSDSRPHIVMHMGAYVGQANVNVTTTSIIYVHGGGSTVTASTGNDGTEFDASGVSIRNLTIVNDSGTALSLTNSDVHHSHVRGNGNGLDAGGNVTVVDSEIEGEGGSYAILVAGNGNVSLDRVTIHHWMVGVQAQNFGAKVNITNTLIYDTTDLAFQLTDADSSSIAFSTIANVGTSRTMAPRAVVCSSNVTFRSSIIWAPGTTALVPLQGCNVASSIAGPSAISGVSNADPMFVNSAQDDYHLAAGSPAIDSAQAGPDHDFEGDARPQGPKFDIGADEVK